MSDAANKQMMLDEFLGWDDGTNTRYELVGGFPVATAPLGEHGVLSNLLGPRLENGLAGRWPCPVHAEVGVLDPGRADTSFIADRGAHARP